jgi:hypothetical protein
MRGGESEFVSINRWLQEAHGCARRFVHLVVVSPIKTGSK